MYPADALVIAVSTDLLRCCLCPLVAVRGYRVGNLVFPLIWCNESLHRPRCEHWRVKITSPSPPLWVGINVSPFTNIGNTQKGRLPYGSFLDGMFSCAF